MKLPPDHQRRLVQAGSAEQKRLCRKPDRALAQGVSMERQIRQSAWEEAQHIKSVKRLEREGAERQRERQRSSYWFKVKSGAKWGESGKAVRRSSVSHRAVRTAARGALPSYSFAIRDKAGKLFVFQRIRYSSAAKTKQGHARDLTKYGIDGAHVFTDGSIAFSSNVAKSPEEAGDAFDQVELINRTAARNAKTVFHSIMQSCHDLTPEEQFYMVKRYCEHVFGSQDLPYSLALHPPSEKGDQRNWHVHVVFSFRPMVRAGEGEWEVGRFLRTDLDSPEQFKRLRFLWAEEMNHACEKTGIAKRYTHLSYQSAGVDFIPQAHLGPALTAKVRRGEVVRKNLRNLECVVQNSTLHVFREMKASLSASVAALHKHMREEFEIASLAKAVPSRSLARKAGPLINSVVEMPQLLQEIAGAAGQPHFRSGLEHANDDIPTSARSRDEVAFNRSPRKRHGCSDDLSMTNLVPPNTRLKRPSRSAWADWSLPAVIPPPARRNRRVLVPGSACPEPIAPRRLRTHLTPPTHHDLPKPLQQMPLRSKLKLPKPSELPELLQIAARSVLAPMRARLPGPTKDLREQLPSLRRQKLETFHPGHRHGELPPALELPVPAAAAHVTAPTQARRSAAPPAQNPPSSGEGKLGETQGGMPAPGPSVVHHGTDLASDIDVSALRSHHLEDTRRRAEERRRRAEASEASQATVERLRRLVTMLDRKPSGLRMDEAGIVTPCSVHLASLCLTRKDLDCAEAQRLLLPMFAEQQLRLDQAEDELFRVLSATSSKTRRDIWITPDDVRKVSVSKNSEAVRDVFLRSTLFDELVLRLNGRRRDEQLQTRKEAMQELGLNPDLLAGTYRARKSSQRASENAVLARSIQGGL